MNSKAMKTDEFESLLQSLQEAVAISKGEQQPARAVTLETPDVREARANLKLPRAEFARVMGVSPRTVEGWEQGRRRPSGAASLLLRIAVKHPRIVKEALRG
jgi:putative transcriptional regulator